MHSVEWRYFSDLRWPLTTPNHPVFTFSISFHIFVAGGHRDVKFGIWIDRSKFKPMDDKESLKGAWSRSREPFKFRRAPTISLERLQIQSWQNTPKMGVVRVTWPVFKDFSQNHIFLIGEAMHFKFRVSFDTEDTSVCMVA